MRPLVARNEHFAALPAGRLARSSTTSSNRSGESGRQVCATGLDHQFTGNDGRVVERGDFAITAGADDSACYAGSYMMTWAPQDGGDDWKLQILSWQDLETGVENCK
jgi:hypothetical protein